MTKLVQFSSKFIIDPSCIKAIYSVYGSGQKFRIYTDHQFIDVDYEDYRKLRKYMYDNKLLITNGEIKDEN